MSTAKSYDSLNRLTSVAVVPPSSSVVSFAYDCYAGAPKQKLQFSYDANFRRTGKKVHSWSGSAWQLASEVRYVYDGWNLVGEVGTNGSVVRAYVWGLDLSGTMQGAGGVGGLLAVNLGTNGTHFVAYDGNGNVSALVEATTGAVSGNLEYGPFGEPVRVTGAAAIACPIRFSTKYEDAETHWLNYTFRLYNPSTGRWRNRDPFEEFGGFNVYSFSLNAPTIHIDTDGRVVLESVGAATSVGTGIGSTAGTSFTGISQTFTFVGGGSSGAAGAGAAGAGTLFAGGAIGFVGGYAAGRIIDNATDGALSDIYAGTFSTWTDWWYDANADPTPDPKPTGGRSDGTDGGGTGTGNDDCRRKRCRPCIPPVGTVAYEIHANDVRGVHKGIPHVKLRTMKQFALGAPPPYECKCYWSSPSYLLNTLTPPRGAIPISFPAAGGGVEYY